MGCCHSTPNSSSPISPPLEQLESVKQVLSEIPIPKPTIPIHPTQLLSPISDHVSTVTQTDKLHDFDDIPHRISRSPAKFPNNRSLSHECVPRRDRSVGKSPTPKSDLSPGRINGGACAVKKLVQSRDTGQRFQSRTESPYRRSRSPATTRTDGVLTRTAAGRSPSVRRSGMSPGRDCYRKEAAAKKETIEGKWQTNESVDNPLVSLECFIFL